MADDRSRGPGGKDGEMDSGLARRRVAEARVARLATITPDGRPHLVPCCFSLAGDVVYTAVDRKPKSTLELVRVRNIAANPSVSLVIDHYEEDWASLWWVRLDGTAEVLPEGTARDSALEALTAKYAQYGGVAIPGPAIALQIERWVSWP
jgi:PPOX class probable F420-dependent enzyme